MNVWRILSLILAFVVGLALPATATAAPPAPLPAVAIAAPTQVHAHAGMVANTLAALVTWKAPELAPGASMYRVFTYQGSSQQPTSMKVLSSAATFAVITNLTAGQSYTFRVQAVSAFTSGSALSNAVTLGASTLPAPGALQPSAGNGTVALHWTAVAGASHYVLLTYRATGSQPSLQDLAGYQDGISATSTTVTGLTNGTNYLFEVRAVDAQQLLSPAAALTAAPQAPTPPARVPDPVTDVRATLAGGQVTVSWAPAFDGGSPITSYTVATSTNPSDPGDVKAVIHPATDGWMFSGGRWSAPVSGLAAGHTYTFYLFANNALGTSSAAVSNAVIIGATVPGSPTNIQVRGGDRMAVVSWNHPSSDGGSPILRYVVTPSLNPNDVAAVVDLTTAQGRALWTPVGASVTISGLTNGRSYVFYVYAVNAVGAGGFSLPSATVTLAVRAPDPVTGLTAVAGNAQATVSWVPAYDGGSPITSYVITYSANLGDVAGVIHPATDGWRFSGGRWSITIGSLTNGKTYSFYVYAVNGVGPVAGTGPSNNVVPVAPARAPDPVSDVRAVPGNGMATVSWLPAFDGGSTITSYGVYTSPQPNNPSALKAIFNPSASPTMFSGGRWSAPVYGLTNGQSYTFYVYATNAVGTSPPAASAAITLGTVPGMVRNLSAAAGDGTVTVTWDVPTTDGGVVITGYGVTASDGTHAPIAVRVSGTSATLPGLTNGVTYSIKVAALNGLGSGPEAIATAMPRNLAPTLTAPSALSVHHGDQVSATVAATGPESTDHLVLTAAYLPNGVSFSDLGNGSGVLKGNAEGPAGTYPIAFSVSDGHNPAVTTMTSLTVTREQAVVRLLPTAPLSVTLKGAAKTAKSLTIGATVREATDPNGNADIGEAADITYTLTAVDTGATYTGHATTTGGGIEGVLTAKNTFRTIPTGVYELKITVGGAYYQGGAEAMVAVSNPSIKGGLKGQGSVQVPGNNASATFTVNVTRTAGGALTGSVRYSEGTGWVLKSTRITALVVKGTRVYVQGMATLNGVGGHQFVVTGIDNHLKGSIDRFGLRVIDPSFATVNHCAFAPVPVTSGQVRLTR